MTDLKDKTVLITGAGGGFGMHMVEQFGAAGCRLLLTDLTDKIMVPAVEAAGERLVASVAGDLATAEGCGIIAGACSAREIVPDVLVNNAGIAASGRLDLTPKEKWETMMQLNLLAPMRLVNLFLPAMIARNSGHVVNISSLAGWIGTRGLTSYCASKFGLRGFGEALSEDLENTDIFVTNVYPCFSRTPILDSPQYGVGERRKVPDYMVSDPADVVAHVIDGVRKNRLSVFPDKYSRQIHYLKRFAPWIIPRLNRRMEKESMPKMSAGE